MTDTDIPIASPRAPRSGRYLRFGLAALPWIAFLACAPLVNRVEPVVLGLPFLLFWIVLWVVLTSACMGLVYLSDPANRTGQRR